MTPKSMADQVVQDGNIELINAANQFVQMTQMPHMDSFICGVLFGYEAVIRSRTSTIWRPDGST